ncbi:MAG: AAA family ATPase [Ruminococcus flavefaciens]|nr:AAA family ATPase [Ruminococcus flavefaciens]
MKIIIERFGPIDKFEYDLEKDFIVTYGNNNIGKSYAMQIVYLLLKSFIGNNSFMVSARYNQMYLYPRHIGIPLPFIEIESMIKAFKESDQQTRDITDDIVKETNNLISAVFIPEFINSCKNTFGNLEKTLEKNPTITVIHNNHTLCIDLKASTVEVAIDIKPVHLKKTISDFHKSRNLSSHLDIYVVENIDDIENPVKLIIKEIRGIFMRYIWLISNNFESVYFLPASRSGIYAGMNAFGSIVAELSKNRAYFTRKIEFPGISEPISDYFIALSNIKIRANEDLKKIYSEIEDKILKGKVTFEKNKNALMYKPNNIDALYEMTEVSSMVSEISPIVAFLKYIISAENRKNRKVKSILFIEEPEAHLHPNNQIMLMEIFSQLISMDVKLIMSSHSNYVFNKINNLILSGELDYNKYDPIVLEESVNGSISKHVAVDDLGADDENFVDVSEVLYNEREEIIESLNAED